MADSLVLGESLLARLNTTSGQIAYNGNFPNTVAQGSLLVSGTTALTASAGVGQATPANVVQYLIVSVNGTNFKVPLYNL